MKVTVFGGANPKPGEDPYEEAVRLGRRLGEYGHTILTGGYIGTMEAVSRGASEAGAHVIGVTCREIEAYRPVKANAWVREEWYLETLVERLMALIRGSEAAIALPGGAGTLAEISLMWNLLIIHSLPPRPLILLGKEWKNIFQEVFSQLPSYTGIKERNLIQFADSIEEVVALLDSITK
jgi:uncharacterized protein (TIGR00730 family)